MSRQYTPVEGVRLVSSPWEEGEKEFYLKPEAEEEEKNSSFPGWSSEEIKEWTEAAKWVSEEDEAVESWAQLEVDADEAAGVLQSEYDKYEKDTYGEALEEGIQEDIGFIACRSTVLK